MEKATKNRLQFVHCEKLFETNEDAIKYVENGQAIDRPSLYAEPMVLKYGDETEPNIILAFGSVGDGETLSLNNKTFFIDFAEHSKQISKLIDDVNELSGKTDELEVLIHNIINACGKPELEVKINVKDTSSGSKFMAVKIISLIVGLFLLL